MKRTWRAILSMIVMFAALCVVALAASSTARPLPKTSKTLQNLEAAYNGESNAHAKYLLFAQKAAALSRGEQYAVFI